jgi:hypothetical protein
MSVRLCWTCKQPATHALTRDGSIPLDACDNCTRIDRDEAESRGWTVAPITTPIGEQAKAKVAAMATNLNDEALCIAWTITETQPVTKELALTRGWLLDELHKRLGDDLFDEWLIAVDENGKGVDPQSFLARRESAGPTDERPVHIRQRIARKRGNSFYRVQYGPSENGSRTLCGAPAGPDMAWGETRYAKNLAYVTCDECKRLRQA